MAAYSHNLYFVLSYINNICLCFFLVRRLKTDKTVISDLPFKLGQQRIIIGSLLFIPHNYYVVNFVIQKRLTDFKNCDNLVI